MNAGRAQDGYRLISGLHRLEAVKELGWAEVPVTVLDLIGPAAVIAECDENLCGTNLSKAERALFTKHRKVAHEALHPDTKNGNNQYKRDSQFENPSSRFTADTAAKTGRSERDNQRSPCGQFGHSDKWATQAQTLRPRSPPGAVHEASKVAYEALHPETKVGAFNQHTVASRKLCDEQTSRFTADTSAKTGQSERSVQLDVERGRKLTLRCTRKLRTARSATGERRVANLATHPPIASPLTPPPRAEGSIRSAASQRQRMARSEMGERRVLKLRTLSLGSLPIQFADPPA
jgi:hypothetical protein